MPAESGMAPLPGPGKPDRRTPEDARAHPVPGRQLGGEQLTLDVLATVVASVEHYLLPGRRPDRFEVRLEGVPDTAGLVLLVEEVVQGGPEPSGEGLPGFRLPERLGAIVR